jgi:peptide chain release factor
MPSFGITPKKEAGLRRRMESLGIREEDLEEKFIRGGGPGGQKINRTASCVQLRHVPTGHEVRMQKARSQGLNRFYARRRLCELLESETPGKQSPEEMRREKIRKQKARRRRRTQQKHENPPGQEE